MGYLKSEDVLNHLRFDDEDDADELSYISNLKDMVESIIEIEIGEPLADLEDEGGNLPGRLYQAMLLLVGHFYLIREPVVLGVTVTKVPLGFEYLLAPFRNYTVK